MPKVKRGRISGSSGMSSHSASELVAWANKIECQIQDPENQDDPKWLKRCAEKLRALADKKEAAVEQKALQKVF